MIVDASVILRAFFPDEAQAQAQALVREHITENIQLKAPDLLPYELTNAVCQAERRGRISSELGDEIIQSIEGLHIEILPVSWMEMLAMERRYQRSAYDAAYLALAKRLGEPLITGDERLYHALHDELDWVLWIEEE